MHDQYGDSYNTRKQVRSKTSILKHDLWDYNDAYIVVKGTFAVSVNDGDNNIRDKKKTGHQHLKIMHYLFRVF